MPFTKRQLQIKISSASKDRPGIPVNLIIRTLQSFQESLYDIANSKICADTNNFNLKRSFVQQLCELRVVSVKQGSVIMVSSLPERKPDLFPDFPDYSEQSLKDLADVSEAISSSDVSSIIEILPDERIRGIVVPKLFHVFPNGGSGYRLELSSQTRKRLKLSRPKNISLNEILAPSSKKKAKKTVSEKPINAICKALVDETGKVIRVKEIYSFSFLDAWPYQTEVVTWGRRRFFLKVSLFCDLVYQDEMYTLTCSALNMVVAGQTRESAIDEFSQEFAMLWDDYASADDGELTGDAKEIKDAMLMLVSKVEEE